jgi:1-acyl-sn-glycerol-3-phosphate acyltransferase
MHLALGALSTLCCLFLRCAYQSSDSILNFSGKEHALVICNHRSDIDWLVGWVLAQVIVLFGMTFFTSSMQEIYTNSLCMLQ